MTKYTSDVKKYTTDVKEYDNNLVDTNTGPITLKEFVWRLLQQMAWFNIATSKICSFACYHFARFIFITWVVAIF